MSGGSSADPEQFDCVIEMAAPPEAVLAAFFSPEALRLWWGTSGSVTTPRPLGIYAVEWTRDDVTDDVLGPPGGALYGVVIDVRPGREFFLADVYWMPPDGDPIGPMALHVTCEPMGGSTRVRVHQSGCDDSPRWRRYYRVMGARWTEGLARLKRALEDKGKGERGKS